MNPRFTGRGSVSRRYNYCTSEIESEVSNVCLKFTTASANMSGEAEYSNTEDAVDSGTHGDISPVMGDILPDFMSQDTYGKKRSKSIIDIFGVNEDRVDAGSCTVEEEERNSKFFRYRMNHKSRGLFVIFNHKKFEMKNASQRVGTDIDRDNLTATARGLGFEVFAHNDFKLKDLTKAIEYYSAEFNHSDYDCFACAVLTHGKDGDYLYANDDTYSIQELISPFRDCSTLVGKPKLYFIQACRGTGLDDGTVVSDCVDAGGFNKMKQDDSVRIPIEADFLIAHSTVEGYFAWRNGEKGSWFIQALCYCLGRYGDSMELMQIMTRVNQMVAYDFKSNARHVSNKKQMPSIVTRLTGDIYFQTPDTAMEYEATDGIRTRITQAVKREFVVNATTKRSPSNSAADGKLPDRESQSSHQKRQGSEVTFLEKEMMKTEIELTDAKRKKAEIEIKVQDLRKKILEYKIGVCDIE